MSPLVQSPAADPTPRTQPGLCPVFLCLSVLACYWSVVIHQLGVQWSVFDQYHYGWAVPFLCAYLVWRAIERWLPGPADDSSRRPAIAWLVALCALAFAPTRLLHEANPIWRLTSFLMALEVIGLTLCFVRVLAGSLGLRRFAFPVAFFLVAVPWPSGLENFLVQSLTRWNVAATIEVLGLLGVPAIQHGNVIEIGAGMVGVNDACSGIRSMQATFMISLFLGEFYWLGVSRRVVCVLAGVACSFVFNLARTCFLTFVGARKGTPAISLWHDPAGVTILIACFVALWLLARWLAARESHSQIASGAPSPASVWNALVARAPRIPSLGLAACLLGAWLVLVQLGTELWFRSHETGSPLALVWELAPDSTTVSFTKVNIPGEISGQFNADTANHELWRDPAGNTWQLFYFRWFPGHSLKKRVAVQLAKTHGPEKCLPAIGMNLVSDLGTISVPLGEMTLAFRQFLFSADGQPLHVFYGLYEDPAGGALANRRRDTANRIAAALSGSRNYGQRFLEIAISGPQNPADAAAALARSLPSLISVKK